MNPGDVMVLFKIGSVDLARIDSRKEGIPAQGPEQVYTLCGEQILPFDGHRFSELHQYVPLAWPALFMLGPPRGGFLMRVP